MIHFDDNVILSYVPIKGSVCTWSIPFGVLMTSFGDSGLLKQFDLMSGEYDASISWRCDSAQITLSFSRSNEENKSEV